MLEEEYVENGRTCRLLRYFLNFFQECDFDQDCVQLIDYDSAFSHIKDMFEQKRWNKVLLGKPWAYTSGATYAVYKLLPSSFVEFKNSPIMMMKAQKNEVLQKATIIPYIS